MRFRNNEQYEGAWDKSMRNGQGIMRFDTGDRYVGWWVDDLMAGQGQMRYSNNERYFVSVPTSFNN